MARSLHPFALAIALSLGAMAVHGLGMLGLALILPSMIADLGWTYWHGGLLAAASAGGYVSGLVMTLSASRVIPVARVFQLSLLLAAGALVATGAVRDIQRLVFLRFVFGLATAALLVCGTRLATSIYVHEPDKSRQMRAIFDGGTAAGLIAGGIVLPNMLASLGYRGWPEMWLTLGLVAAATLPFVVWACRGIAPQSLPEGQAEWTWRRFIPLLAARALFSVASTAVLTFLVMQAIERGADVAAVAAIWTTLGLAALLAPVFWKHVLPEIAPSRRMTLVLGLCGLGAGLFAVPGSIGVLVVAAALLGFAVFIVPSLMDQYLRDALPRDLWGAATTGVAMVHGFSQPIGPLIASWVADRTGSLEGAFALAGTTLCLSAFAAWLQHALTGSKSSAPAGPATRS